MLGKKIKQINWNLAKQDISRFIQSEYMTILNLWGVDFFTNKLQVLEDYL